MPRRRCGTSPPCEFQGASVADGAPVVVVGLGASVVVDGPAVVDGARVVWGASVVVGRDVVVGAMVVVVVVLDVFLEDVVVVAFGSA